MIKNESVLEQQWQSFVNLSEKSEDPFFARRADALCQILDRHLRALPAKVIFRENGAWRGTIWINVGKRDNQALGSEIVSENSPVVVGKYVVGVVE